MRKKILIVLLCCAFMALLCACGDKPAAQNTTAASVAETTSAAETLPAVTGTVPETTTAAESTAAVVETTAAAEETTTVIAETTTSAEDTTTAAEIEPPTAPLPKPLALAASSNRIFGYAEDEAIVCYVDAPSLTLMPAENDFYAGTAELPQLEAALNNMNSELAGGAVTSMEELKEWALNDYNELDEEDQAFYNALCIELNMKVQRADTLVLSLLTQNYSSTGGVHPNTYYGAFNFDSQSGRALTLQDICTDTETLADLVVAEVKRLYPDTYFFVDLDEYIGDGVKDDSLVWVMDQQGICFYFSPYELASYADGLLLARLEYADYAEIFNEKYLPVPEAYARQLLPYVNYSVDVDGDGKPETLYLYYETEEYDAFAYGSLHVLLGDKSLVREEEFFSCDPYLVYADGWYLYFFMGEVNDYSVLAIYRLDGEGVSYCSDLFGTGYHFVDLDGAYGNMVLTCPDHCVLDTRVEMLSTMEGRCEYAADRNDGVLYMVEPYYTLENDFVLTLKQDFELPLAEGEGTVQLKEGDELRFVRSDGENYVDMRTRDGAVCRIVPEQSEDSWIGTLNGVDIFELFDGMMFAG